MSSLLDRFWYNITKAPLILITWTLLCRVCSAEQVRVSVDGLAIEGSKTRLNCTTERYVPLNRHYFWERTINGASTKIISLYVPHIGQSDKLRVFQSPYDRFSVEVGYLDFNLIIDNTTRADRGTYTCKVDSSASNVTLNVVYLDLPTIITRGFNLNENDAAIFTCILGEGNPKPSIVWLKDGEELDVFNATKYPASKPSLVISMVTTTDEGIYKCKAENEVLTRECRETATLTLNDSMNFLSVPRTPTTGLVPSSTPARQGLVPLSTSTADELGCKTSGGSVVGMTFLGIIIGTVLTSSVGLSIILWKKKTSKGTQAKTNENQAGNYMEYQGGELKTGNQTYQDLSKKDDQVYVNINAKKGKRKYNTYSMY